MGNANTILPGQFVQQKSYEPPYLVVGVFRELADNVDWTTLKISSNIECSGLTYWPQKITEINIADQTYNRGLACSLMFEQEEDYKTYFGLIKPAGQVDGKITTEIVYIESVELAETPKADVVITGDSEKDYNMSNLMTGAINVMPSLLTKMTDPGFKEKINSEEGFIAEMVDMAKDMKVFVASNTMDEETPENFDSVELKKAFGMARQFQQAIETGNGVDDMLQNMYQMIKDQKNENGDEENEEEEENEINEEIEDEENEEIAQSENK